MYILYKWKPFEKYATAVPHKTIGGLRSKN